MSTQENYLNRPTILALRILNNAMKELERTLDYDTWYKTIIPIIVAIQEDRL